MIVTKRAYEPAAASDGFRVLIDRLWPRGVSKAKARLNAWEKDIDDDGMALHHANEIAASELAAHRCFVVWGAPYFAIASSSAATADIGAEAIRQPHARTWRIAQSSTAVRSEATAHRNVGRVHCPHLIRRVHAQPTQQIRIAIRGV